MCWLFAEVWNITPSGLVARSWALCKIYEAIRSEQMIQAICATSMLKYVMTQLIVMNALPTEIKRSFCSNTTNIRKIKPILITYMWSTNDNARPNRMKNNINIRWINHLFIQYWVICFILKSSCTIFDTWMRYNYTDVIISIILITTALVYMCAVCKRAELRTC